MCQHVYMAQIGSLDSLIGLYTLASVAMETCMLELFNRAHLGHILLWSTEETGSSVITSLLVKLGTIGGIMHILLWLWIVTLTKMPLDLSRNTV